MKGKFLILISFIFILSIAAVSATEDLNQTDNDILESDANSDLEKIINDAPDGATISLERDYVSESYMGLGILIDKSITINGNGHTLTGKNGRLFYIESGNVVLNNITVSDTSLGVEKIWQGYDNPYLNPDTGEINDPYGDLNRFDGGAIYSKGNLEIINCRFLNNAISSDYENYDYSMGGAVYSNGDLRVVNSSFISNKISGYAVNTGAALYCRGYLNIINSLFENNTIFSIDLTFAPDDAYRSYCEKIALWAYEAGTVMENCTWINNYYSLVDDSFEIDAQPLVKYYHGRERFTVKLTDDAKAIADAEVKITINGVDYYRTTDKEGIASMAINLNSGKYDVIVKYRFLSVNSTITVKPTVSGENITKIFRNATQYYATFVDGQGNSLAENTAVEFNINGVFYTRYTNEKGTARMNINLNPGEYIITAKNPSTGEQYTNVITVLPSIVENHDLVKYYMNASQYSVKILGDDGNPVGAGVAVSFNINGVFYTRYTNESGYAKLNINLEPGSYVITAEYNDLRASNNITVLPVIESRDFFETIQKKIDAAHEGDTIYLDNDVIRGIFYVDGENVPVDDLFISKSLTIDGGGHTIDACSYGRVFNITSDNVTLKNITFINGYVNDYGSAIYNTGDNLLISDCIFRGNVIHYYDAVADEARGGAICTYADMTVTDSLFENNTILVVHYGLSKGGAIYSNATLNVQSCEFKDNLADDGEAIWAYAFNANISDDCNFINNDVALVKLDSGMELNINQRVLKANESVEIAVNFYNNVSGNVTVRINDDERIIGIVNNSAALTLSDLSVGAYSVSAAYPENDYFESAFDTGSFRVLSADAGSFADLQKLIDDTDAVLYLEKDYLRGFDDNYPIEINKSITLIGNGHVIFGNGSKIFKVRSDNVTLKNITFTGAYYSDDAGGAVAVYGDNAVISSCNFIDNALPDWSNLMGAALFIEGDNAVISESYFTDNRMASYFGMDGGAVYCRGDLTVINSIFKDNEISATDYDASSGGAIYCDGDLTVINSTFISNLVSAYVAEGGAIYTTGTLNITDSIFESNELYGVDVCGGAVLADKVFITNSVFNDNYISGSKSWDNPVTYSLGGAVSSSEVNIYNSSFTGNTASTTDEMQPSRGGAVYSSGICNIDHADFTNNSAGKGDSVWAYQALSNVTNSSFVNNSIALVKAYIEAPALAKMYHGSENFKVYLFEDAKERAGADVNININGKDYTRTTDEDGIASMAINLNSGEYNVTVTYEDAVADSMITVESTVFAEDLIKRFGDAGAYSAIFYGTDGYILAENTEVEFNINGVFYKRYTNGEGVAFLNINLQPGEYEITAKNPLSGEMHTNTVTVLA